MAWCFVVLAGLLRAADSVTREVCGLQGRGGAAGCSLTTANLGGYLWGLGRPSCQRQRDAAVIESPSWEQSESVRWDQHSQLMTDSEEHLQGTN